jgi:hypothetical protein
VALVPASQKVNRYLANLSEFYNHRTVMQKGGLSSAPAPRQGRLWAGEEYFNQYFLFKKKF